MGWKNGCIFFLKGNRSADPGISAPFLKPSR